MTLNPTKELSEARREELARALAVVFSVLSDDGSEQFEQLCRAEGLLWVCRGCKWNVSADQTACPECGVAAWDLPGKLSPKADLAAKLNSMLFDPKAGEP